MVANGSISKIISYYPMILCKEFFLQIPHMGTPSSSFKILICINSNTLIWYMYWSLIFHGPIWKRPQNIWHQNSRGGSDLFHIHLYVLCTYLSSHLHFQKHDFNITNPYPISMYLWSQHHCCCSFVFLFISFLFFLMPFATTKEGRKSISMSKSVTYPFIMLPQYIVVLYTLCM